MYTAKSGSVKHPLTGKVLEPRALVRVGAGVERP